MPANPARRATDAGYYLANARYYDRVAQAYDRLQNVRASASARVMAHRERARAAALLDRERLFSTDLERG